MLARTTILAAAAVLSVGATVHANEQQTDNNTTTSNATNVQDYELDTTSSSIEGNTVESGNGSIEIEDGLATLTIDMRTAPNNDGEWYRLFLDASNFVPPAPGEWKRVYVDRGAREKYGGEPPDYALWIRSVEVFNVDGTYEVQNGTDTVAVFGPA
ncbi:MAG: hypothetical protein AAGF73_09880 [Actinomycetota bacterium]